MKRFLISIGNIPDSNNTNNISINPTKPYELFDLLFKLFTQFPNGSEVLFNIKLHGAPNEKHSQEQEYLFNGDIPINTKEITDIISMGRNSRGFKTCGLLQICHGNTYKNLLNSFDMCISSEKKERSAIVSCIYTFFKFF